MHSPRSAVLLLTFAAVVASVACQSPTESDDALDIDDVAEALVRKLIHRHPPVLGAENAETSREGKGHRLRTKAAEERGTPVNEGISRGQPALRGSDAAEDA